MSYYDNIGIEASPSSPRLLVKKLTPPQVRLRDSAKPYSGPDYIHLSLNTILAYPNYH
jgi:hypothetical protein